MKKFAHQQFIEDNKIDKETLPDMLKKRMQGFEELQEDLEHTTEEDEEALLHKLEMLSHELAEDLEEHFEDELENNDVEEEEEVVAEIEKDHPIPTHEEFDEDKGYPSEENTDISEPVEKDSTETHEELTDEDLLEQLYEGNMLEVLPAHMAEMGFKTRLIGRNIAIGKFLLHKGKYDKRYKIALK
jgi:hypothetical protein